MKSFVSTLFAILLATSLIVAQAPPTDTERVAQAQDLVDQARLLINAIASPSTSTGRNNLTTLKSRLTDVATRLITLQGQIIIVPPPPPLLCTDPKATNPGKPLPCTYPISTVGVPDIVGVLQTTALLRVTNAGLVLRVLPATHPTIEATRVISQFPLRDTQVAPGSEVAATISLGPALPPPPTLCTDPLATNQGQPLPCVYPVPPPSARLWTAGMETSDLREWYQPCLNESACGNEGGGEFNSGTGQSAASRDYAHTGSWSLKLTASTPPDSGTRLFRWREGQTNSSAFYSAWFYFPEPRRASWTNLFQWKSVNPSGSSDPFWYLQTAARANGTNYLMLTWWGSPLGAGPHVGESGTKDYTQTIADLPVARWVHVEAFLKQASDFTGQLTVWQDGVEVFNLPNIRTRYAASPNDWSINNYGSAITPNPSSIYADDAVISLTRVGPGTVVVPPTLCTDPTANNQGQPLPCTFTTPPPPPPPTSGVILDDFSGSMRQTTSGENLWRHYAERGSGSVSITGGIARETVSSGGGYFEFYPKGNNGYCAPGYTKNFIKSGTWSPSFNRLSFKVKSSQSIGSPGGSARFELGTYRRTNSSDCNWAGDHFYHRLSMSLPANQWVTVVINNVPQHQVGGAAASPGAQSNYFDALTRWYVDAIYDGTGSATLEFDDFRLFTISGEPDTLVSSVTGVYTGSGYEVSWQTPATSGQGYTVRYSPTSMKTAGFASGTAAGSKSASGDNYTGVALSFSASKPTGGLYIGIQPTGSSSFTEIYVP